ncbi:hypothetical protein CL621_04905 [archaeon]|nr:hypothetical protein [archaeon]|tara:strand:+ start:3389 stop:3619 length:231 start_codon:yes stop_codon:yes gene_type:complete
MTVHKLNLESYTIGDEFKAVDGDKVVSSIKTDGNGKVTSLEVAQLFLDKWIHVGIYRYIYLQKNLEMNKYIISPGL